MPRRPHDATAQTPSEAPLASRGAPQTPRRRTKHTTHHGRPSAGDAEATHRAVVGWTRPRRPSGDPQIHPWLRSFGRPRSRLRRSCHDQGLNSWAEKGEMGRCSSGNGKEATVFRSRLWKKRKNRILNVIQYIELTSSVFMVGLQVFHGVWDFGDPFMCFRRSCFG